MVYVRNRTCAEGHFVFAQQGHLSRLVYFALVKQKGRKEVKLKNETPENQKKFKEAEKSEWVKQLKNKAVRVLSLKESQEIEKDPVKRERILGSRNLYTWKALEDGGWIGPT